LLCEHGKKDALGEALRAVDRKHERPDRWHGAGRFFRKGPERVNSSSVAHPSAILCGSTELAARACESALWLAILNGQQAGFDDGFLSELIVLHAAAGQHRHTLAESSLVVVRAVSEGQSRA
jgi:hypothetical protein